MAYTHSPYNIIEPNFLYESEPHVYTLEPWQHRTQPQPDPDLMEFVEDFMTSAYGRGYHNKIKESSDE